MVFLIRSSKTKQKKDSCLVREKPSCLLCKTLSDLSFFRTQLLRKKHLRFVHSNYFKPSAIVFLIKIRTAGTYNSPLGQTAVQYWCVRNRKKERVRVRDFSAIQHEVSLSVELSMLPQNYLLWRDILGLLCISATIFLLFSVLSLFLCF